MRLDPRLPLLAVALTAGLAGPARAQTCTAPPGTAAVEEYCENVPSAGGGNGSNGNGNGNGSGGGGSSSNAGTGSGSGSGSSIAPAAPVQPQTTAELNQSGADGQQLAGALGGGKPGGGKKPGGGGPPSGGDGLDGASGSRGRVKTPADPGNNPLNAVTRAAGQGATTGLGLSLALLALAAMMAGWALTRRRTVA